jgi:hypothetical protein
MFFQVEHRRATGLKVIHSLDVERLSRLEGYNGIGKSALIRLIQVCVGQHPYPGNPALWESFRDGVGTARVILTDLQGGASIEWSLDAARWEAHDEKVSHIGEIWIDGTAASIKDVRQLFDVHTIFGNEDLSGTLARRLARHSAVIHEATALESPLQQRLDELDDPLQKAETSLEQATSEDVVAAADEQSAVDLKLDLARGEATEAGKRLASLTAATTIATQLSEIENGAGDLAARIEAFDGEIEQVEKSLSDLDLELASAGEQTAATRTAQRELKNAQRHADRMERSLNEAVVEVTQFSQNAEVAPATDKMVAEHRARTQQELDDVVAQLALIHSAPDVADLADDLVNRLAQAESADLGDDTIIYDEPMDTTYTVTQLRGVLDDQGQRLRSMPTPQDAEDLQARIGSRRGRLGALDRLARAIRIRQGLQEKVQAARSRLASAVGKVAEFADHDVSTLVIRREMLNEQLRNKAAERADLIRARAEMGGGATPEELGAQLTSLLGELGLLAADLPSACQLAVRRAEAAHDAVAALSTERRSASQRLRTARQGLNAAAVLLSEDPKFAWIRSSAVNLLPAADADPAVQSRLLHELLATIRTMRQRITALKQQLAAADRSFKVTYDRLRGVQVDATEEAQGVRSWFGEEVSRWFNHPQLLKTVFENGTNVKIDLSDMSVTWEMGDAQISRPLGAFSSGERAFAYTRAQLALIDSLSAPANRLIVLDEFGAFIAREWQRRLEQYLREHAKENPADSTLLILPLTQTAEDLRASGQADKELTELGDAGYYTHVLMTRGRS